MANKYQEPKFDEILENLFRLIFFSGLFLFLMKTTNIEIAILTFFISFCTYSKLFEYFNLSRYFYTTKMYKLNENSRKFEKRFKETVLYTRSDNVNISFCGGLLHSEEEYAYGGKNIIGDSPEYWVFGTKLNTKPNEKIIDSYYKQLDIKKKINNF